MSSPTEPPPEPFFEPLPEPEPLGEPPRVYLKTPWQPPQNIVPVPLDTSVELARTDDTVLVLSDVEVYPQGVAYAVRVWLRPGTEPDPEQHHYSPWPDEPRLGWLLDDGTKIGSRVNEATQLGPDEGAESGQPRVSGLGSSAGDIVGSVHQWLYPVPPGERWTAVVEWAARGIPETRTVVDAAPIHAAAGASDGELWPLPDPPEGEYGWFSPQR
jgi:hypothetical protein